MELSPYVAYSSEVQTIGDAKAQVIICLTNTLSQDQMPSGMDLYVYGDDLTIGSKLTLPGNNLTIVARKINFADGAHIDLSGKAGAAMLPAKAANGEPGASPQNPDATDGRIGLPGNPGQPAGNLKLVAGSMTGALTTHCDGGAGSPGQDGGDGGTGLKGADGAKFITTEKSGPPHLVYELVSQGQPGTNGGRAGSGGAGGAGGNGGKGGQVIVQTLSRFEVGNGVSCAAGAPGQGGAGGVPGSAGAGGTGGLLGYVARGSGKGYSSFAYFPSDPPTFAAPGNPGAAGVAGAPGSPGLSGAIGAVINNGPVDNFDPSLFPLQYLQLVLRAAEFAYLDGEAPSGNYARAVELLVWLTRITPAAEDAQDPERARVRARVNALLAQVGQRLDFYGEPRNHVPLASLSYYQGTLTGEITAAAAVERIYQEYVAAAGNQSRQIAALHEMLAAANSRLASFKAQLQPLSEQITAYQATVSQLKLARNLQAIAFDRAEQKWQEAILEKLRAAANQAQCKSYMDIFTAINAVVSIENPDELAEMGVKFDFGKVNAGTVTTIGGDLCNWNDSIRRFETAQANVAAIASAASELGTDILGNDGAKIAVDRANFELMLAPYKQFDATGVLEAQLNLYLAKAQAFNQKQVDYNALQIRAKALTASIATVEADIARVQNQLSASSDPTISLYKTFVSSVYVATLANVIRDVYGLRQAYRYWALADYVFPPSDGNWNAAYLSAIQVELTSAVTDQINNCQGSGAGNPVQQFDYRIQGGAEWIINDPAVLESFKAAGPGQGILDFCIPIDDPWVAKYFTGMAQVVATDYVVEVRGSVVPSGQLLVYLSHSGIASFIDTTGKRWQFSHLPVRTSFKYDLRHGTHLAGGALSGDDVEIGLSPFTSWRLTVSAADNPGLDLSGVTEVVLKFAGRYRTAGGKP